MKQCFVWLILFFSSINLFGQDLPLSQINTYPIFTNPAHIQDNANNLYLLSKNQLPGPINFGQSNFSVGFSNNADSSQWGWGMVGYFNKNNFYIASTGIKALVSKQFVGDGWQVHFGGALGINRKFLTNLNGGNGLPPARQEGISYINMDFGGLLQLDDLRIGLAISNANNPSASFVGIGGTNEYSEVIAYADYRYVADIMTFMPYANYRSSGALGATFTDFGLRGEVNDNVRLGVGYRTTNALLLSAGTTIGKLNLDIHYDYPISRSAIVISYIESTVTLDLR